ncbi:unnamed protein product [Peronospora belbahrii]|uniref:CRAL-TRIO domain-containing protein n=1 Tax=Peronospora belbahrii TaxID=622444 RepID=A0AAU9KRY6_9STRA|nr:unnamed protein product [Peronospora belbahrii]
MNIGRVLLRDGHNVWHEKVATVKNNALILHSPSSSWDAAASVAIRLSKKIKSKLQHKFKPKLTKECSQLKALELVELLPLDGSLQCEDIVVSSAHRHAVRLQDVRSGREFLVDVTTKGKKQMWIDLFTSAQNRDTINTSYHRDVPQVDSDDIGHVVRCVRMLTLGDRQQGVNMLVTATKSNTAMTVLRGYDVEDILLGDGSAENFTADEASIIAKKLVEDDVLLPFCCSCSLVYRADRVYCVNTNHHLVKHDLHVSVNDKQKLVDEGLSDGSGYSRGQLLSLHDSAFQDVLALFDRLLCKDLEKGISGTDCINALLQFGAYNAPTAIELANDLLCHEFIVDCFSSNESKSKALFQISSTARYKKVCREITNDVVDHCGIKKHRLSRVIVSSEREDRCELEVKAHNLKEDNSRLFNLCGFCCVLLLVALVTTVLLPLSLNVSLVAGLLLWLSLSGISAPLSFNFEPRSHAEDVKVSQWSNERRQKRMDPTRQSALMDSQSESTLPTTMITKRKDSAGAKLMREKAMNPTAIVLTQAQKAEVHSFRLAIEQAASVPAEATAVFSDEYLFSVLCVKNRAFAYAVAKMARVLQWRHMYNVDSIEWTDVKSQLVSGSMYWYGYDFRNRPILWVRAKLKDWTTMSSRREVEIRAHVYLLELGCRHFMPPGVTTFTIVTDSTDLGMAQMDLRLMKGLLNVCVANFPDRIGLLHAGPLTRVLKYITSWMWPLLPVRLRAKVSLMRDCVAELTKHMDSKVIPLHFGGTVMHNLCAPCTSPTKADDKMDINYMCDQQKRFMEELKI